MNNKKLFIGSIILAVVLIMVLFLFTQKFNKTESARGCPWIFKTNVDYTKHPSAFVNDERTKITATPFINPDSLPEELNGGYLLHSRSGCNAEEVKYEYNNPHNLVFFDITYGEYDSIHSIEEVSKMLSAKIIPNSILELYICDPIKLEREFKLELKNKASYTEELNKIILQGELNTKCEKII